ncbi:MAG TPA: nucleotidyltransferase family protein [Thermodesulfobacteriota bacterium]|nr:nucleotidyltransferase family protein [Thermodesulfobacteriota bacterium]
MKHKPLTKKEIMETLRENRATLEKYGVKRIGLFGSYLRGEQNKHSDIDFVVEFDMAIYGENFKGLFDAFMGLSRYVERLFDRKVDILTPDSVKTIRIKGVKEEIERSVVYV